MQASVYGMPVILLSLCRALQLESGILETISRLIFLLCDLKTLRLSQNGWYNKKQFFTAETQITQRKIN